MDAHPEIPPPPARDTERCAPPTWPAELIAQWREAEETKVLDAETDEGAS